MKSLCIPLAGLLLFVLVSVTGAAQSGLQKLTVGYAPVSGAALPLFIAIEEKLFQKYGYDVSGIFMGSSQLINTALLTGELLLGYAGGGGVISSRLAGSDLIAIASPLPVLTIDGWAKPEIKSIGQLRGKRIGITRFGASTHFAALSMLESAGVRPNEVVFIQNGGVGESLAALLNGRVDLAMAGDPYGSKAKNAGFHLLFRPAQTEYGLFPTSVVVARELSLKDTRTRRIAVDFLRALHEGTMLARENAAVTKKALRRFTRVEDDAALQATFESFKDAFSASLRVPEKAMARAQTFVDHPKAKQADVKLFFDNTLVDQAMK